MGNMFYGATVFNQNLCHFGDNFSQITANTNMFMNSGCSNTNDPTSASGPWCNCYLFTTNSELRTAIKEYLSPEQGCTTDLNCLARTLYGGAVSRLWCSSMHGLVTTLLFLMSLLTIQIGEWDVSNMTDFSYLFLDASWVAVPGADTFNEAINWDTGMRSNDQIECFPPPDLVTESEQCLGSAMTMRGMFYNAAAFNQPLSLDTTSVTNVRVLLVWSSTQ